MSDPLRSLKNLIGERQHQRILRLSFPNNDGPDCEFVVNELDARESMSRDFEYTIEILSDNSALELKDIQGKLMIVALVRKDGTLRHFSGYCFSFRLKKAGNIAFYEATLSPWLTYLSLRKDNYLFHNATLYDQILSIFRDYGTLAVWDFVVQGHDAPMTDACQFDETDANYLHRRLEDAGIYYSYEHDKNGHKLKLANDSVAAAPIDGDPDILFHRHGGAEEEDAISEWTPVRDIVAGSVTVAAFDFKNPVPRSMSIPTLNKQGRVRDIESYEYVGAYGYKNRHDGDRLARLRMEEVEAVGKHYEAASNNGRVQPGRGFKLVNRLGRDPFGKGGAKTEFLILTVHHTASNNYLQEADQPPHYSNRFTCIRKAIPWRPGREFNSVDTRILAPQTATVVGPDGQGSIYTDEYGRIRVQFHWDRVGERDERSSAWIRVSSSWAGAQLGAPSAHRVGSEVVVQWLDGSPDRPLVTGAVHNAHYMPPWALPSQQVLTGLRSRELRPGGGNTEAGRSNHLILDDTNQGIQAQLKSDHQHSQLSLGHITRIEGNAGRMDGRGEGWELASDAWGVARAGRGMLLTTEARPRAASHIKDMAETVQRLRQARERHKALAEAAQLSGAQEKSEQQADVAAVIDAQNDAIGGKGTGAFPELAAPHLVLASPAGIETTTAQSTHIASGEHTALTTGKSLSIAAGDSFFASIAHAFSVFVQKASMKLIAAVGKILIQAQRDDIELIAHKVLSLISETDWMELRAKKGIRLQGSDSMVEISDLVRVFTSSPVQFHGNLVTLAPQNRPQPAAPLPVEPTPEKLNYILQTHAAGGRLHANVPYTLYKGDAKVEDGLTDEFGRIAIEHQDGTPHYRVVLANGEQLSLQAAARLAASDEAQHHEHRQSNGGWRAFDDAPDGRRHD